MPKGLKFKSKHSSDFNLIMRSENRQVLPSTRDAYEFITDRDGSILFDDGLNDRFIDVEFTVPEKSLKDLRQQARNISNWLHSKRRETLIFDDEPGVFYRAKVANQIDLEQIVAIGIFTVIFRCEPYAYGKTDTTLTNITDSPQTITIESDGVVSTPQKIIVQNSGNETMQALTFEMEEVID